MSQKTISVRSLETDIRQGVEESEALSKYRLTTRQLESLLNRMLKAGHLSDLEVMHWLKMTDSQLMRAFREGSEPQTATHVSGRVEIEKRTIKAKDVVHDIRAHMTDAQLMEKYHLSARGLQSVLKKTIRPNLVNELPSSVLDRPVTSIFTGNAFWLLDAARVKNLMHIDHTHVNGSPLRGRTFCCQGAVNLLQFME